MTPILPVIPPRPYKILAAILDRVLGECICRMLYIASLKQHVRDASIAVYTRRDRPWKADLLAMAAHYVDRAILSDGDNVLPIDWLYSALDRHDLPGSEAFRQAGHATPDLVLTPSGMMEIDLLRFPSWPVFTIPTGRRDELYAKLEAAGLKRDRWLCVLHYREPTYPLRAPTPYRDVASDKPFEELARYVIKTLGCQVVRIGHKEMRAWEIGDGFVDLSRSDDFMLQACAVSLARFAVMTAGGPAHLPCAFGVPVMIADAIGMAACGADPGFMLPRHLIAPNGARADIVETANAGQWTSERTRLAVVNEGYTLVDNTAEELCRGARELYARSAGYPEGWREPLAPLPIAATEPYNPRGPFVRPYNIKVFA